MIEIATLNLTEDEMKAVKDHISGLIDSVGPDLDGYDELESVLEKIDRIETGKSSFATMRKKYDFGAEENVQKS